MAFWLGLVIYYLPSPASEPAVPEAPLKRSHGVAAKSPSADARQVCRGVACVERHPTLANDDESRGGKSSRDAVHPSQDTLKPTDLTAPWRGPALRKEPVVKRSI